VLLVEVLERVVVDFDVDREGGRAGRSSRDCES
jgi:hypothetical protein